MTLAAWQTGAVALVRFTAARREHCNVAALIGELDLTSDERRSLLALEGDRGFALTCHVVRWWRSFRIGGAAPLAIAQLGAKADEAIADYLSSSAISTFFFSEEAAVFLDWLAAKPEIDSTTRSVACFQKALLRAYGERERLRAHGKLMHRDDQAAVILSDRYAIAGNAEIIVFDRAPEKLLAVLVAGEAAAPVAEAADHPVLVSPALEFLWRPAGPSEARLFATLQKPMLLSDALHYSRSSLEDACSLAADFLLTNAGTGCGDRTTL